MPARVRASGSAESSRTTQGAPCQCRTPQLARGAAKSTRAGLEGSRRARGPPRARARLDFRSLTVPAHSRPCSRPASSWRPPSARRPSYAPGPQMSSLRLLLPSPQCFRVLRRHLGFLIFGAVARGAALPQARAGWWWDGRVSWDGEPSNGVVLGVAVMLIKHANIRNGNARGDCPRATWRSQPGQAEAQRAAVASASSSPAPGCPPSPPHPLLFLLPISGTALIQPSCQFPLMPDDQRPSGSAAGRGPKCPAERASTASHPPTPLLLLLLLFL